MPPHSERKLCVWRTRARALSFPTLSPVQCWPAELSESCRSSSFFSRRNGAWADGAGILESGAISAGAGTHTFCDCSVGAIHSDVEYGRWRASSHVDQSCGACSRDSAVSVAQSPVRRRRLRDRICTGCHCQAGADFPWGDKCLKAGQPGACFAR